MYVYGVIRVVMWLDVVLLLIGYKFIVNFY